MNYIKQFFSKILPLQNLNKTVTYEVSEHNNHQGRKIVKLLVANSPKPKPHPLMEIQRVKNLDNVPPIDPLKDPYLPKYDPKRVSIRLKRILFGNRAYENQNQRSYYDNEYGIENTNRYPVVRTVPQERKKYLTNKRFSYLRRIFNKMEDDLYSRLTMKVGKHPHEEEKNRTEHARENETIDKSQTVEKVGTVETTRNVDNTKGTSEVAKLAESIQTQAIVKAKNIDPAVKMKEEKKKKRIQLHNAIVHKFDTKISSAIRKIMKGERVEDDRKTVSSIEKDYNKQENPHQKQEENPITFTEAVKDQVLKKVNSRLTTPIGKPRVRSESGKNTNKKKVIDYKGMTVAQALKTRILNAINSRLSTPIGKYDPKKEMANVIANVEAIKTETPIEHQEVNPVTVKQTINYIEHKLKDLEYQKMKAEALLYNIRANPIETDSERIEKYKYTLVHSNVPPKADHQLAKSELLSSNANALKASENIALMAQNKPLVQKAKLTNPMGLQEIPSSPEDQIEADAIWRTDDPNMFNFQAEFRREMERNIDFATRHPVKYPLWPYPETIPNKQSYFESGYTGRAVHELEEPTCPEISEHEMNDLKEESPEIGLSHSPYKTAIRKPVKSHVQTPIQTEESIKQTTIGNFAQTHQPHIPNYNKDNTTEQLEYEPVKPKNKIESAVAKYHDFKDNLETKFGKALADKIAQKKYFPVLDFYLFDRVSDQTLTSLSKAVEQYLVAAPHLREPYVELQGPILSIYLGDDYGTIYIAKQAASKQLWLDSLKTGLKKFDFNQEMGVWICKKHGKTLHEHLEQELSEATRHRVDFSGCSFCYK